MCPRRRCSRKGLIRRAVSVGGRAARSRKRVGDTPVSSAAWTAGGSRGTRLRAGLRRTIALLCVRSLSARAPDPRARLAAEGSQALVEKQYEAAARAFERLRELSPDVAEVHAQGGSEWSRRSLIR